MVSPRRVAPRLSDLNVEEVTDLFLTVQRVGRMLERVYEASALNVAIQDGEDAGQSVPHVHTHLIPRKRADLDGRGGNDAIYDMIEGEEGNVGSHLKEAVGEKPKFPTAGSEERRARTDQAMAEEATMLAREMDGAS